MLISTPIHYHRELKFSYIYMYLSQENEGSYPIWSPEQSPSQIRRQVRTPFYTLNIILKGLLTQFQVTLHAKMAMSDSRLYP